MISLHNNNVDILVLDGLELDRALLIEEFRNLVLQQLNQMLER